MIRPVAATFTLLAFAAACGSPDQGAEVDAAPESAVVEAPRVAFDPTAADQLPAALLGQAGALSGTPVAYFRRIRPRMGIWPCRKALARSRL